MNLREPQSVISFSLAPIPSSYFLGFYSSDAVLIVGGLDSRNQTLESLLVFWMGRSLFSPQPRRRRGIIAGCMDVKYIYLCFLYVFIFYTFLYPFQVLSVCLAGLLGRYI
jgi:hypothetical protein